MQLEFVMDSYTDYIARLSGNEKGNETSEGSSAEGNGVAGSSTGVAWWRWNGLVVSWLGVGWWWDGLVGRDVLIRLSWLLWDVRWNVGLSGWAVSGSDGGSVAVCLSWADGGVVGLGIGLWLLGGVVSWLWSGIVGWGGIVSWDLIDGGGGAVLGWWNIGWNWDDLWALAGAVESGSVDSIVGWVLVGGVRGVDDIGASVLDGLFRGLGWLIDWSRGGVLWDDRLGAGGGSWLVNWLWLVTDTSQSASNGDGSGEESSELHFD